MSGKRKRDDVEEREAERDKDDSVGHQDVNSASERNHERDESNAPLTQTQRPTRDVGSGVANKTGDMKHNYRRAPSAARKAKSALRGLMPRTPASSRADFLGRLSVMSSEAALEEEPDQVPAQSSLVDSATCLIVRLDVNGVVFDSFPEEKYRVLITEDPGTSETSIEMEERTTEAQMRLVYSDISKFSEPPASIHAVPLTPALVYQALSILLKRACDSIAVDNPPHGVRTEDDGSSFAKFDLVRGDSSCELVMEYPNVSFLKQVHRFPMEQRTRD